MLDMKNIPSSETDDLPADVECIRDGGRKVETRCQRKYSIDSWNSIDGAGNPVSYRVNFSKNDRAETSCPKRRTHKINYEKTPMNMKTANFRDCHFLMENPSRKSSFVRPNCDEFYLGIDSPSDLDNFLSTSQISTTRDQSFYYNYLTKKFNCRGSSFLRGPRRKNFMQLVGQLPVYQRAYPHSASSGELRRKRDWILVKYLTKVIEEDGEEEGKMSYQQTGDQQIICCPPKQRTVEQIEEICCQSFLNKNKEQMAGENRTVELLFSPQGPVLREDKHLTGRSVMFFCCYDPNMSTSMRKGERSSSTQVVTAITVKPTSKNIPHSFPISPPPVQRPATTIEVTKSKQSGASTTTSALLSRPKEKKKSKPLKEESKTKGLFKFEEKAVGEEPNSQSDDGDGDDDVFGEVINEEDELHVIDPTSMKLRPPQLREEEEEETYKPRRRESKSISFIAAPVTKKKTPSKKSPPCNNGKTYDFPDLQNFEVTVHFDDEIYSEEFPQHKTLQDIYSWIKTKLLSFCKIRYGSELLLSTEEKSFPLKADTASTPVSSLPDLIFDCLELKKKVEICTKKYTSDNSRFDAHFGLPLDIRELQGLHSLTYMAKHCSVSRAWEAFYKNVFKNHLKIRQTCLRYNELDAAIGKLFAKLSSSVLRRALFLLGFDPRAKECPGKKLDNLSRDCNSEEPWKDDLLINEELFVGICALSNRIICCETSIDGIFVGGIRQRDQQLEEADFYNIEEKLSSLQLCPILKRLLLYVRKKS